MPWKPKKACAVPGCPGLTSTRYCEQHAALEAAEAAERGTRYDSERESAARRGYGRRWRRLRLMKLRTDPMCEWPDCNQAASEVDHLVPKRRGGTDEWSNLQSLCKAHHSAKTARGD